MGLNGRKVKNGKMKIKGLIYYSPKKILQDGKLKGFLLSHTSIFSSLPQYHHHNIQSEHVKSHTKILLALKGEHFRFHPSHVILTTVYLKMTNQLV